MQITPEFDNFFNTAMPNAHKEVSRMCVEQAFYEMVRKGIARTNENQFAKSVNVRQSTINVFMQRSDDPKASGPSLKNVASIIENIDEDLLLEFIRKIKPKLRADIVDDLNLKEVEVFDIKKVPNADEIDGKEPVFTLRIPPRFFPCDYGLLFDGNSMAPTIPHRSAIGIKRDFKFSDGEIYLCDLPNQGLTMRRVVFSEKIDYLEFQSINPAQNVFKPQILHIKDAMPLLKGRLAWIAYRTI